MKLLVTFFALLLASCSLFSQSIWYVNAASTAPFPNGASWNLAFPDLHDALNAAQPGDEIWVAQGVYKPSDGSDRMAHFVLPSDVALYGGFSGIETLRNARDWVLNQTVLSGDIGVAGDSTDNSLTILYTSSTGVQTLVDGLVFEYGNANGSEFVGELNVPLRSGGAVFLDGVVEFMQLNLSLQNCTFRHNRARNFGGALYINGYKDVQVGVKLDNCVFEYNYAGLSGGGLGLEDFSVQEQSLELTNCTFRENTAGTLGGGVWARHHATVLVKGSSFFKNSSKSFGGGICLQTFESAYPRIFEDCDFSENFLAPAGLGSSIMVLTDKSISPAIYLLTISKSRFYANNRPVIAGYGFRFDALVNQCLFYGNTSTTDGSNNLNASSVFWSGSSGGNFNFNNCLFYKNRGLEFTFAGNNVILNNSILLGQENDTNSWATISAANLTLNNCIVSHATCEDLVKDTNQPATCNSVRFATDPLFIDPSNEPNADFHLLPCSPAINAGFTTVVNSLGISTDFDGNPRIRNGRVDIGPYETNVHLSPDVIVTPSCVGASDGAFSLSGNICPPYTLVWNNGSNTGSALSGLPAGVYSLTITGSNGLPIQETVVLPAQDSLIVSANVIDVQCAGGLSGQVELSTTGGSPFPGIPAYEYAADNPPTMGLAAGVYTYTVSDANGCTATVSATIEEPPPFIVYYTVQNATGAMQADGAIYFDSTSWGGSVPLNDLLNVLPNTYHFTVTDAHGCQHTFSVVVGYSSATNAPVSDFPCRIYPNPGYVGTAFFIETTKKEGFVARVYDLHGHLLRQQTFAPGGGRLDATGLPSGFYAVQLLHESGAFGQARLQILGQ